MSATDYQKQAQDFLDKHGIRFRATLSDSKVAPWEGDKAAHERGKVNHHYRCTLSRQVVKRVSGHYIQKSPGHLSLVSKSRLTFDFWGSIANAEKCIQTVSAYDVLACISGDVHTPETFEDFCGEYGYHDSIKALQQFRRCSAFAKRLRGFFTDEELEALSEIQ